MAIDTQKLGELGLMQTPQKAVKKELGQSDFMSLIVAQIKNQNPMEPSNNTEFISQMAQFGTMDGISNLNKSFESLSRSMTSNQALQATTMVGKKVLVPSQTGMLMSGNSMSGAINASTSVGDLRLSIYDQQGAMVKAISLGPKPAGSIPFQWDGTNEKNETVPPGTYHIRAEGLVDGKMSALPTDVFTNVDSVTLSKDNGSLRLNLNGLGSVGLDQVKTIQ